eukprot:362534-Chlamydomonas_euryale.AAC.11
MCALWTTHSASSALAPYGTQADVEAAKNSEDAALFVAPEEGLQQSVSDRVPGVPRVVHPRTNLDDMEEAEGNDWSVVGEKVWMDRLRLQALGTEIEGTNRPGGRGTGAERRKKRGLLQGDTRAEP